MLSKRYKRKKPRYSVAFYVCFFNYFEDATCIGLIPDD